MNAKEELTKLLMESYERGWADAEKTALVAAAFAYAAGAEAMRERCAEVVNGYVGCDPIVDAIRAIDITPASTSPQTPT
jgi:hypothetical protein